MGEKAFRANIVEYFLKNGYGLLEHGFLSKRVNKNKFLVNIVPSAMFVV